MFQLSTRLTFLTFLLFVAMTLKPSEVGVNDWAINTLGELKDVTFTKNKIYFLSHLNSIGIMDKYTGKIEGRALLAESEKVVGFGDMIMNVVTRYSQVVSYFITATGLDKKTGGNYKVENKTVQWLTRFDENEYFITKTSLHHGKELIKQAESDQTFLRVTQGTSIAGNILYVLYRDNKQGLYCVESYINGPLNKYCWEEQLSETLEFQLYEGHLVISVDETTLLLSESLELVQSFKERVAQFSNGAIIFKTKVYSIKGRSFLERRPVKSSRQGIEISLFQGQVYIIVFKDDMELFRFKRTSKSGVLKAWFNFKSEMDYDLLIQYDDLELICYSISRGEVQEVWKREESLAYVQDVIFMKYHELDTLDNQYHRNLIMHSYRSLSLLDKIAQVPKDIALRLQEEISDLQHFVFETINYLVDLLNNIDGSSIRKFEMAAEQQIKYGLRKYLIVATKYNTMIAIDTKTHQILWKVVRRTDSRMIKFVHLKRDYETEVAVILSYSQQNGQASIEEITEEGEIKPLQTFNSPHQPSIYKLNDHNIAIKFGDKIEKFGLFKQDDLAEKQFYFYTQEQNTIHGWKAVGGSVTKIWNFHAKGNENILKIASAFRGDQTANIPLFDNEKVFFKNVDFTNLAVLTNFNRTDVALYIINGRTGKIHYNSFKKSISMNMPINLVYDENNVLVSYFNHKSKNFQIWTIEQFQERIETSALNMITDYMKGKNYEPQESREKTIFSEEVYGSSIYIKLMEVSESKMSLTRRNIFIITRQNKLYTIGRDFVSTRRPKKDAKSFFANEKFPQYAYFLPFLPNNFLSYNLQLANINKIAFNPTDMESTIFTLCYGTDLFMIRNAPDKTFDMITQDFNHLVLILILIAVTVVIVVLKRFVNFAKIKKPHLE